MTNERVETGLVNNEVNKLLNNLNYDFNINFGVSNHSVGKIFIEFKIRDYQILY